MVCSRVDEEQPRQARPSVGRDKEKVHTPPVRLPV